MNSSIVTEVTILPHREKNSILFGLPSYMQPPCPVLHELWLLDVSVFAIALCDSLCPCPVEEVVKRRLLFSDCVWYMKQKLLKFVNGKTDVYSMCELFCVRYKISLLIN